MDLAFKVAVGTEMQVHIAIFKAAELMKKTTKDQVKIAKLKTAISELGQNIIKYAKEGSIAVFEIDKPKRGIMVLVEDTGPGIPNLEEALQDNFSTSGTLGLGLPGVRRMVDDFAISSEVGRGTKVSITIYF